MAKRFFEISSYHDYVSPLLAEQLLESGFPISGVPGLIEIGRGGGLENKESLAFLVELYIAIKTDLRKVLDQRVADRKFIDERVEASFAINPDAVFGLEDGKGRIVIGPKTDSFHRGGGKSVAPLPDFLKGPHVTLFGPPDSAKMAINAMNAYHRKPAEEPAIVEELLGSVNPMWGADDEDSKTPLRTDLIDAAVNLTACFDGSLELSEGSRHYELAKDHLSLPIKRFPGLALPSTFLFYERNPIPLHLYDFALHLFRNWDNPRSLVFYVPKLENDEEAAYIHTMIKTAERMIKREHPEYKEGTVRVMIVLENPRAILRAHEIMDALHPYFAGASLGWHDYLASTARIFKNDSGYRIPVKADPGIVIKYIKASHQLLAETVGSRGGIRVGGMYGILPLPGDPLSLQITLKGFIKDVITQLKRGLNGFWVAHPDFMRPGLALVEAWRRRESGDAEPIGTLVTSLLNEEFHEEVLDFIKGPDIEGLDTSDPGYVRSLLVADIKESDFIPNNDPEEIRYNVFQSLQYLADWLSGNGCVALPTEVEGVQVRVMDDLATAERSRWEVWHELHHGRFPIEDFVRIAHEEMNFIRRDLTNSPENHSGKIVQVKWDDRTSKWYPIAFKIMLQLMTDANPPEFATELLMPFTVESMRKSESPWSTICSIDPDKFRLSRYLRDLDHYFEICGSQRFAQTMAQSPIETAKLAEETILSFSLDEIREAAHFHGNIGDSRKILDTRAAGEQSLVLKEEQAIKDELTSLGETYRKKYGVKFLTSAQGKTAAEIRTELKRRLGSSQTEEEQNARLALWEISRKRMEPKENPIDAIARKHGINSYSAAVSYSGGIQKLGPSPNQQFEIASLSKTLASAFALEYLAKKKIELSTSVNKLLEQTSSTFRIDGGKSWGNEVQIQHLMSHTALDMHYVKGFPVKAGMPAVSELIDGNHGYEKVTAVSKPGTEFRYSGGGYLVLEHLIEALAGKSIRTLTRPFFDAMGLHDLTFDHAAAPCERELDFPAFAAGAFGTAADTSRFLQHLSDAYHSLDGSGAISHDTAMTMLHGVDKGAREFIGCEIGLGVFIAEAGHNRLMIHQGANEGFRALYAHCFAGPDRGKGLVLLCHGNNEAVPFIAEAAREILKLLEIEGINFDLLQAKFQQDGLKQEEIVNLGYKKLLFDAFMPDLPEEIVVKGPKDPLADSNLAVTATISNVTDQKFARAENLISSYLPIFDPELFGNQGKIMDSWETVRHNELSCDSLILELKSPAKIKYVSFSTMYHDGNHAEFVRLEGRTASGIWKELVPKTPFKGHSLMRLEIENTEAIAQVRLEMYPDGGISRLQLFDSLPADVATTFTKDAKCVRFHEPIPKSLKPLTIPFSTSIPIRQKEIDWASAANGGRVVSASNEHYGPAAQVISPYPPIHMFDGLESARSRTKGHFEEVVISLGKKIKIGRIELDFRFFVNNNPAFVAIHGFNGNDWIELVAKSPVKAFAGNQKRFVIDNTETFEQVKLQVFPDGGVHRIKVFQ